MAKIHNDKYYTPDLVVKKVIEVLEKDVMPIEKFTRIIEPSAGAGAFLNYLPEETLAFDIELQDKRIKNVEILTFSKSKNTTKKEEKDWLDIKSDIRFIGYGTIRVLKETDKKVRAKEIKIILQEKVNIKPVIEKFLKDRTKVSVSTPNISKREIIELIYGNFPQLRE